MTSINTAIKPLVQLSIDGFHTASKGKKKATGRCKKKTDAHNETCQQISIAIDNETMTCSEVKSQEVVEWNVSSSIEMQVQLIKDAKGCISDSRTRTDNLEHLFAWIFDTKSDDAFGIVECSKSFGISAYDLQRRFYRLLVQTVMDLPKSTTLEKRTFYKKLQCKVRAELMKNAPITVELSEQEAAIAEMETQFNPTSFS